MPQDFYTLEQAAERLGVTPEELVQMAQRREIRAFMDRGTQRFRKQEVEELARQRGMGSDVELQLGEAGAAPSAGSSSVAPGSDSDVRLVQEGSDVELKVEGQASAEESSTAATPDSGAKLVPDSDSDVKLVEEGGDSSVRLAPDSRPDSDSDVRLDAGMVSDSSSGDLPDSGVRLVGDDSGVKKRPVDLSSPTEEINLDDELRKAQSSSARPPETPHVSASGSPTSGEVFNLADDDEEESSSVHLGTSDPSGVNLESPSDKGMELDHLTESSEEELAFDLEVDENAPGNTPPPQAAGSEVDSSSEFELTLDEDPGLAPLEGDQGEAVVRTDMVLPLQQSEDSGSEELALESGSSSDINLDTSDFELALDEEGAAVGEDSGSEVIVIDEGADEGEATAVRPQALEALEGEIEEAVGEDEELVIEEAAEDEQLEPVAVGPAVEAPPAEWGWWSLVHLPTTIILLFVGFLLFEMLRSIWSYSEPTAVGSKVFEMFSNMMK